ncbi:acyltransferase family protein [Pseudonocardia humida]|uniref:Acyltransferase n=1 Tax=Pseudonocardia humida TaxID=2800819 RepID=A0ABT1A9A6_9PSEU|nr:acyltransferase [Pseudonocardia humida]MCO1659593.1 acyltransferase [Pseudonocardia humida]
MTSRAPGTTTSRPAAEVRPGASAADRTLWADAAKGLCILLVVSWHVIWKHYLYVDWALPVPLPEAWSVFGRMLLPMRMPLFFAISGMFAASAVARPWSVVARTRVARFLYLYAIWLLIHTAVMAPIPMPFDTEIARNGSQFLEQLTVTPTALWYLMALAVYFVIAKLVRTVPAAPVLALAFALSAASAANWIDSPGNRGVLYQNLLFFLAGLYLRRRVESLATGTSWLRVGITGAGFAVVLAAMLALDAKETPGVWPVAGAVAAVFGITVMAKVARWRWLGGPMAALGRQTLPIYVIHMPALVLAHWALLGPLGAGPLPVRFGLALLEPVLLTAALVGVSLGLHALLQRVRAGWLFELPGAKPAAVADPSPAALPVADPTVPIPVVPIGVVRASWPDDDVTMPVYASIGAPTADALTMPMPRVRARPAYAARTR